MCSVTRPIVLSALLLVGAVRLSAAPKHILFFFDLELSRPSSRMILQATQNEMQKGPAEDFIFPEFVTSVADVKWLLSKYRSQSIDLLVTINPEPIPVALKFRELYNPHLPLIAALNLARQPVVPLGRGVVVLQGDLRVMETIRTALALLPDTQNLAFVGGASPSTIADNRAWIGLIRKNWPKLTIIDLTGLSLEETERRAALLPPHSICFLGIFGRDANGLSVSKKGLATALDAHASAPMFDYNDISFGAGTVGGWMVSTKMIGNEIGKLALRILGGESTESIGTARVVPGSYRFDDRQLKRWHIPRSRLPARGSIEFTTPPVWQIGKFWLAAALACVAAALFLLFYVLRGFQRNRVSTPGQLASALAHEVNQPLSAILSNTEVVQEMLRSPQPDLQELKTILSDLQADGRRAASVVRNMRSLLRRNSKESFVPVDISEVVRETISLVEKEAASRGVRVEYELAPKCLTKRSCAFTCSKSFSIC